jgi:DNA-binding Lrp family transcriptional regulator
MSDIQALTRKAKAIASAPRQSFRWLRNQLRLRRQTKQERLRALVRECVRQEVAAEFDRRKRPKPRSGRIASLTERPRSRKDSAIGS